MISKTICLSLVCLLCAFFASAITLPYSCRIAPVFNDTSYRSVSSAPAMSAKSKKVGFFGKLKAGVLRFFVRQASKGAANSAWGFVALGLLISGVVVFALGAGGVGIILVFLSLVAAAIAVIKNRGKEQPVESSSGDGTKNKSKINWRLIAAIFTGAVVVALIIALASWKMH